MRVFAIATALFGVTSSFAFAQSCATPGGPIATFPFNASGNTCSGGAVDEFGAVCGGGIISAGPSDVYQFTIGPSPVAQPNAVRNHQLILTVTPSGGYDTAIYLVGPGACAQTTGCPAGGDADNAGPNGAETITILVPPPGTYYVVVDSTASGSTAPACGPYTLSFLNPSSDPVELRNFSVD